MKNVLARINGKYNTFKRLSSYSKYLQMKNDRQSVYCVAVI